MFARTRLIVTQYVRCRSCSLFLKFDSTNSRTVQCNRSTFGFLSSYAEFGFVTSVRSRGTTLFPFWQVFLKFFFLWGGGFAEIWEGNRLKCGPPTKKNTLIGDSIPLNSSWAEEKFSDRSWSNRNTNFMYDTSARPPTPPHPRPPNRAVCEVIT